MGIYVNPRPNNFLSDLQSEIYIDKSRIIEVTNKFIDTNNKFICVSRPRRFGKTMLMNLVSAYYTRGADSRPQFERMKISTADNWDKNLNKLNVIVLDINDEYCNRPVKNRMFEDVTKEIKKEMIKQYPNIDFEGIDTLALLIKKVFDETNIPFVLLFDEYDALFREKVSEDLIAQYLQFLNGLFKSNSVRPAIALAYLTGILPIFRDRVQSKLNNFKEYTMILPKDFDQYIGFTEDEVKVLCEQNDMDFAEAKRWYDGYVLNDKEIFNSNSLVQAIENHRFASYWSKTGSYEAISDKIEMNFDGIQERVKHLLAGESIDIDVDGYTNSPVSFKSAEDVFTFLIHLGYLCYDPDTQTCRIPNMEIRQEWIYAIRPNSDYAETNKLIEASRKLLEKTIACDEEFVANSLNKSHFLATSDKTYNNEFGLQAAIMFAYMYAMNDYYIFKEMQGGKGYADLVLVPAKIKSPAIVIELKYEHSPDYALKQIKERQYFEGLNRYHGELLFVGINYTEDKTHKVKIEHFSKK